MCQALGPSPPSSARPIRLPSNREKELLAAAAVFGLNLQIVDAENERDFDVVFRKDRGAEGRWPRDCEGWLLHQFWFERLAALTVRDALPAVSVFRPFAFSGGLMSYGGDLSDLSRQIGIYAGRILKGEKPGRAAGRAVHQGRTS